MVEMRVNVWHNMETDSTAHDGAFDAIVNACDQIFDATQIGYSVQKRDANFGIDPNDVSDMNDFLNRFEQDLNDKGLYNSEYSETYILVYDYDDSRWLGQARYHTGDPDDDSWRDYPSAANRYGLGVIGYNTNSAGSKNAAAHEMLHTFMSDDDTGDPDLSDHQSGSIYYDDEVSPMGTGYGDDLDGASSDNACIDNGDPDKFTSALSVCTMDSVEDYLNNIFENR